MYIVKNSHTNWLKEYGILIKRLSESLSSDIQKPPVGLMLCKVSPGESATLHSHEDNELLLILQGTAKVNNKIKEFNLEVHDLIYIERDELHTVINTSDQDLFYLSIYWVKKL